MSDAQLKWAFIAPTILLLVFIVIYPLVRSLHWSFTDYQISRPDAALQFVGTSNYGEILTDGDKWLRFRTTAALVGLCVSIEMLLGFGIALLLNRPMQGRGLITVLLLTPMMLCPAIVGLFWRLYFSSDSGIVSAGFALIGLGGVRWLTSYAGSLAATVIVDVWMWTPFVMIISLAGLSSVPKYLYEAAEVDRASGWFKFRQITLPLVAPFLVVALLFRTMDTIKLFDVPWVLAAGNEPLTVSSEILKLGIFQTTQSARACAMAYIVLVLVIAVSNLLIDSSNA